MAKLTPEQWHVDRARAAQVLMRLITVEGVTGNDEIAPVTLPPGATYPETDEAAVNVGVRRLAYAIFGAFGHGPWTPLVLQDSWTEYGSGLQVPQYRARADGDWELRGVVFDGLTGAGTAIATLPEPARPAATQCYSTFTDAGVGRLEIYPDGRVTLLTGGNGWVFFNGITWSPLG
ncbi:MAG: hypothetical protein ACOZQL_10620 [Myxococcota bacterium]